MAMTPEDRKRLTKQLTIITAPLASVPKKALSAAPVAEKTQSSAEESAEASPVQQALEVAPPRPERLPRWALPTRLRRWRLVLLFGMAALALLGTSLADGLTPQGFLSFSSQLFGVVPAPPTVTSVPTETPADDLAQKPTISIAEIDRVLESVNSPMLPYDADIYATGVQYGIDPVFALAFWMKESREASDGSVAAPDHNPGYTEGLAGDPRCGRWACWPTWPEGIAGWFHYMRVFFIDRGISAVEDILPIYAPSSENNTSGYIVFVLQRVATWRAESAADG